MLPNWQCQLSTDHSTQQVFVGELFTSNSMLLTKVSSSEHIAGLGVHVKWNTQAGYGNEH